MAGGSRRNRALPVAMTGALAVLVLGWWSLGDADTDVVAQLEPDPTMHVAEPAQADTAPVGERERPLGSAPVDAVRDEADLDLPHRFTARIRVQDWNGLPLPGAHVLVAPPRCGFCRWPQPTDARGIVEIELRGRAPTFELWVVVAAWGTIEPMRVVELEADRVVERVFVARGTEHDAKALKRRIDESGPESALEAAAHAVRAKRAMRDAPIPESLRRRDEYDTLCGRSLLLFEYIPCHFCHEDSRERTVAPFVRPPVGGSHRHPHGWFCDLGDWSERAEQTPHAGPEPLPDREQDIRREYRSTGVGTVRGIVRDANGQAVPGAVVAWIDAGRQLRNRARTDEDGRFRLLLPATGTCPLLALAAGIGHDEAFVAAAPGAEQQQDFVLREQSSVRGRVTTESGAPLAGGRVEFVSDSEPGAGSALVAKDGAFAITDVPRSGRLLLWPGEADLRLPLRISDSVLTDRAVVDLALRADEPVRARLSVSPVTEDLDANGMLASYEVRVLQLDTGCAAHAQPAPPANGLRLEGLAAGPYRVDVGRPGRGWVTSGPVHLDGHGLWDLGTVQLPARGRIRLVDREEGSLRARAIEFWHQREDTDVRVQPHWLGDSLLELPVGTYALVYGDDADTTRSRRVELRAGTEVAVPIDR